MFAYAEAFNKDISMWSVRASCDFTGAFFNALSFNQYLNPWELQLLGKDCGSGAAPIVSLMFIGSGMSGADCHYSWRLLSGCSKRNAQRNPQFSTEHGTKFGANNKFDAEHSPKRNSQRKPEHGAKFCSKYSTNHNAEHVP
jgi:hypothetical protein